MRSLLLLLCALPYVLAMRPYMEIERRPSAHHDVAGNVAFAVGLITSFSGIVITVLFVGAYMRSTKSLKEPTPPLPPLTQTISMRFMEWK